MSNKSLTLSILLVIFVVWSVGRFISLDSAPKGFYVDEAFGAGNITKYLQKGTNIAGNKLPLFSPVAPEKGSNYPPVGFTSPTYFYLGAMWATIFGTEPKNFRAFTATISLLTILGIAVLAYQISWYLRGELNRYTVTACITTLAIISPSLWQFSRIAWDPPLMPCFVVWGLAALMYAYKSKDTLKAILFAGLGGFALLLSIYSYSAAAPIVIMVCLVFFIFILRQKRTLTKPHIITATVTILILGALALPFVEFSRTPEAKVRGSVIGLFSPYYKSISPKTATELAAQGVSNLLEHYNPRYLWISGDKNLRHSTGAFGILSWVEVLILLYSFPALLITKCKKQWTWLGAALAGTILGILPAALTWEGVPHALRSIASIPFFCIFFGILAAITIKELRGVKWIYLATIITYTVFFMSYYFFKYPEVSQQWFDIGITNAAQTGLRENKWEAYEQATQGYPIFAKKYHEMRTKHKFNVGP